MTPQQYCINKTNKSGSSFLPAFYFLGKEKRMALTALYAFCREVDDIVDGCDDYKEGRKKLNWWSLEVSRLFSGTPQHPVTKLLVNYIYKFDLDEKYFNEIIDGMEMDLNFNRYENFTKLQLYCYRAASAVGILSAKIFGFNNINTLKYAHDMGIALQLTNIIRDLGEDAKRGRIYIPLDELKLFDLTETDILKCTNHKKIKKLVIFLSERAQNFFFSAVEHLPAEDKRKQLPGLMMGNIYFVLLKKIVISDPEKILNKRTLLSPYRRVIIALTCFMNCTWIK
ncbi:presqualene diphosphate synthase HpnD [Methylophilaceae bacterium]|nr:presqualene diphosphate synthase HpnD [Methylophilaceae bacterium]